MTKALGCTDWQFVQVIRLNYNQDYPGLFPPQIDDLVGTAQDSMPVFQGVDPPYENRDDWPFYHDRRRNPPPGPGGDMSKPKWPDNPEGDGVAPIFRDYPNIPIPDPNFHYIFEAVTCLVCNFNPPRQAFKVIDCVWWSWEKPPGGPVRTMGPVNVRNAFPDRRGGLDGQFDRIVKREFPDWEIER